MHNNKNIYTKKILFQFNKLRCQCSFYKFLKFLVGSVFGGYPLAYISSNYGWDGAYLALMLIAALTGCVCIVLTQTEMKITFNKKKKE